ncbi:hypothetical protein JKP88DRAFT_279357 [Tribonema minus]|uniref:Uncharacterized protein n=1 Tax=Tribonema minus TaxID=303371 RepID=A0A836CD26_9STRA|nr:hypothetical protein JKP88DRAFT_279357 [Tribonema minus]
MKLKPHSADLQRCHQPEMRRLADVGTCVLMSGEEAALSADATASPSTAPSAAPSVAPSVAPTAAPFSRRAEQQRKRRRNETSAPASTNGGGSSSVVFAELLTSGGSSSDVFAELLVSGGVQLAQLSSAADGSGSNGTGAVVQGLPCTQHPSVLRRHLSAALEHEPATAAAFISGFAELLAAEQEWLQRALLPLAVEVEVGISGVVQDSLVKVLLRVDCIQNLALLSKSDAIKLLVEKLSELAMAADGDDSRGAGTQDLSQDLPRLILTQMRWLDHLVDPGGLTEKLLEVLPVLPLALERDLIAYLPEKLLEVLPVLPLPLERDLIAYLPEKLLEVLPVLPLALERDLIAYLPEVIICMDQDAKPA